MNARQAIEMWLAASWTDKSARYLPSRIQEQLTPVQLKYFKQQIFLRIAQDRGVSSDLAMTLWRANLRDGGRLKRIAFRDEPMPRRWRDARMAA